MWAISSDTVDSLVGLSLNFFLILPFMNAGMFKLLFLGHESKLYSLIIIILYLIMYSSCLLEGVLYVVCISHQN